MQIIEYRVRAVKIAENKAHLQTFKDAQAAFKARDYLISKGYSASVSPVLGVKLTVVI